MYSRELGDLKDLTNKLNVKMATLTLKNTTVVWQKETDTSLTLTTTSQVNRDYWNINIIYDYLKKFFYCPR